MKYIFIIPLILLSFLGNGQHAVGFSLGGNFSSVNYKNSNGVSDKSLKGLPGIISTFNYRYNIGYKVRRKSVHQIGIDTGYKSSKFEDKESSLFTTWNMQFISTAIAYRYYPYYRKKTGFFFGGGIVYDFLLSGTQTQGFSQFDISKDLAPSNLSVNIETGIKYNISYDASTTLTIGYLRGLTNIEKDLSQQAFIHSFKIAASVFFRINTKKQIAPY